MKFLAFSLAPFVLAFVSNGLDALNDDLDQLLLTAINEYQLQAEKVKSLEYIFKSIKSRNQELRNSKEAVKVHSVKAIQAQQLLHGVKGELESHNNKIVKIEKKLHDAKVKDKSQRKRAVDAEKLLNRAKSEGNEQAKKIVTAEELLQSDKNWGKSQAKNIANTEKLLGSVKGEGESKVAPSEKLFRDAKEEFESQYAFLGSFKPFFYLNVGDKLWKETKIAKKIFYLVKDEIKLQAKKLESVKKLLQNVVGQLELYRENVIDARDFLNFLRSEVLEQGNKVVSAEELLRNVKDGIQSQAKNILKAEKLLEAH